MQSPPPHSSSGLAARTTIALATFWVAAGALFKLFSGSPNDLPPLVQQFFLGPLNTFRGAIAIELCIVVLALLRPRHGWLLLVLLFLVFDAVLVPLVQGGAASCGCFGSKVPIPPWAMMTIDSLLLLGILLSRPWRNLPRQSLRIWPLLPLLALCIAAPFYKIRAGNLPVLKPREVLQQGTGQPSAQTAPGTNAGNPTTEQPTVAPVNAESQSIEVAEVDWPDFHELKPESWIGSALDECELRLFLSEEEWNALPTDGELLFYRQTCEYCKEHLEALALAQSSSGLPRAEELALVRIPDRDDTPENAITNVRPQALAEVDLQLLERGYGGITPPAILRIAGYVVTGFEEIEH